MLKQNEWQGGFSLVNVGLLPIGTTLKVFWLYDLESSSSQLVCDRLLEPLSALIASGRKINIVRS